MSRSPTALDIIIGKNIRRSRKHADMTESEMADDLGVTYQQLQKYEKGINRICASRLWKVSELMGIRMEYFFKE